MSANYYISIIYSRPESPMALVTAVRFERRQITALACLCRFLRWNGNRKWTCMTLLCTKMHVSIIISHAVLWLRIIRIRSPSFTLG